MMRLIGGALTALAAIHHKEPILALMVYLIANFLVFMVIWRYRGLDHVELTAEHGAKRDWKTAAYYSLVTLTSFSPPSEIPPVDGTARAIIGLQSTLSYITIFWIIMSPRWRP